jgi:uncharacterized membrane protein
MVLYPHGYEKQHNGQADENQLLAQAALVMMLVMMFVSAAALMVMFVAVTVFAVVVVMMCVCHILSSFVLYFVSLCAAKVGQRFRNSVASGRKTAFSATRLQRLPLAAG